MLISRISKLIISLLKILGLLLIALSVTSMLVPQVRSAFKTTAFILQVIESPVKPLDLFIEDPIREEVRFPQTNGEGLADLYRPSSGGRHSAVLLFLGVNPAGRNDKRVVNLAESLTKSGMIVMIPWSQSMTEYRIDPKETDNLVSAYKYLLDSAYVDEKRVGIAGFCVGASLSAVAAANPEIRDNVKFINFFGGYFDAKDLMISIASKTRYGTYGEQTWEPSQQTLETFQKHLISSLESENDRSILSTINISENNMPMNESDLLTDDGLTVYKLLNNPPLNEARYLINELPDNFQKGLETISPINHMNTIKGKLLIMHDVSDNNVPVEESRRFYEAAKHRNDVLYTEFAFFDHVDLGRDVNLFTWITDVYKLYVHLYHIIRVAT